MNDKAVDPRFIPLDKSWMIRMGVLDLLNGYDDSIQFLENQNNLNNDLVSLLQASKEWRSSKDIHVGESGTLYRFLRFASWKLGLNKNFIMEGTLKTRKICDNPKIIDWSIPELLKLDNETSQWASASALLGNKERIENPPYKLELTYEALEHWSIQRSKKEPWLPRYDKTISNQANAFVRLINGSGPDFRPTHSEDYCFARAFDIITKEEGEKRWPSLIGHESNRLEDMEKYLKLIRQGEEIDSNDHRIVQSIAMLGKVKKTDLRFSHSECVKKSWPQFWDFLAAYS